MRQAAAATLLLLSPLITCELENYFALFFNLFPFYYFPTFLAGSSLFLFYLCGAVKFTLLAQVNLLLQAAAPRQGKKQSREREENVVVVNLVFQLP